MSNVHTLVISISGSDADGWDADYSIECPAVTDACRMWVECDLPTCRAVSDGDLLAHGKRHQNIGGTWSVPTDTCYLIIADETPDAADYLATKENLGAGRYPVGHDFDEGLIADLHLAEEVSA